MEDKSLCGASCRLKYFPNFSKEETLDISNGIGLWAISITNETYIKFNVVTYNKIQIPAVREGVNSE